MFYLTPGSEQPTEALVIDFDSFTHLYQNNVMRNMDAM